MSAHTGIQTPRFPHWSRYQAPILAGGSVTISFLLVALAIVVRRQSEPSSAAIEADSLTSLAISLTTLLLGIRFLIESVTADRHLRQFATWLLTLTHLLGSLTLGLTAPSLIVGAFPIMIAVTAECMRQTFTSRSVIATLPPSAQTSLSNGAHRLLGGLSLLATDEGNSEWEGEEEIEEDFAADCTQRISRFRVAAGESLSGQVRAEFQTGEKTKAIHVAFCPPLAEKPTAEVFQVAGPTANIKQTLLERFGMRLEIKLAASPVDNAIELDHSQHASEDVIVEFLVESKKACA